MESQWHFASVHATKFDRLTSILDYIVTRTAREIAKLLHGYLFFFHFYQATGIHGGRRHLTIDRFDDSLIRDWAPSFATAGDTTARVESARRAAVADRTRFWPTG